MSGRQFPGKAAREAGGWIKANRYLLARRFAQVFFLSLFLTGPWFGFWITKGTLASSITLDILPLSDPFILSQQLVTGYLPELTAFTGAAIVLAGYVIFGGRSYCAWVCPVNPVTDFAAWLRARLNIRKGWTPRRDLRIYMMVGVLAVSALTGSLAWELINPVTTLHRAIVFGGTFGLTAAALIFFFDLYTAKHGWCGHLCPVGAFYGLVGKAGLLRVSAMGRSRCNDCMDCFEICPEPQVIAPALRGERTGHGPVILSGDCLNCGRCLDVCSLDVFSFTHRFNQNTETDALQGSGAELSTKGG